MNSNKQSTAKNLDYSTDYITNFRKNILMQINSLKWYPLK